MKKHLKKLWPVYAVAGVLTVWQPPVQAQTAAIPAAVGGRFFIELKDANLADALEMVYKASGNPAHIIDDAAKDVKIASAVFPNITAEDFIRQITTQNKFVIRKNASGTPVIEPRTPVIQPRTPGTGKPPTKIPGNPFDIALEVGQKPTTLAEAQVAKPATPTTKTAKGREKTKLNPNGEYRLLVIRHVYAGGIARLFADSKVIPTEQMVLPESAGGGGGGRGGGGGGISGGIGGQQNGGQQNGGYGQQNGGYGQQNGGYGQQNGGQGGGGGIGGGIISDRNLKENIVAIDSHQVLERVAELPIKSWNYKDQDAAIRHIGPMAQDFAGAFGVGEDNRRINAVDANGVTLASIQALYKIALQQSEQIKVLQQELAKVQADKNAAEIVGTEVVKTFVAPVTVTPTR